MVAGPVSEDPDPATFTHEERHAGWRLFRDEWPYRCLLDACAGDRDRAEAVYRFVVSEADRQAAAHEALAMRAFGEKPA